MSEPPLIILAGNPNVGKSTIFNYLTGLHQHTGNWTGKTVANAVGICKRTKNPLCIADIPGVYSLDSHTPEEQIAADYIIEHPLATVVVVCDSCCLWRGLTLAIQIAEMVPKIILCLNLSDQADRQGIAIDVKTIEQIWNIPIVPTSSKSKGSLRQLVSALERPVCPHSIHMEYAPAIETELAILSAHIHTINKTPLSDRYLAMKVLSQDHAFCEKILLHYQTDLQHLPLQESVNSLALQGYDATATRNEFLLKKQQTAHQVCRQAVTQPQKPKTESTIDRWMVGRFTALPIMVLGLFIVFWLTIVGAQYPSQWLWDLLFSIEPHLLGFCSALSFPTLITHLLVFGIYRVVAWVVSVMLPPMAIFFPLFTLMEDIGILPRIAFNLDHTFQRCRSCGKQAITMCMGFGCNAVGVTGCRIIRSRRERLIATVTNALVPCNGRFPTIITLLTVFFSISVYGAGASLLTALELTAVILLGVFATFLWSFFLSKTFLKGESSHYSLELPPYRIPKAGQVLIRSILDRTVFVLLRSLAVAAPAGLVIWLLANLQTHNQSLLQIGAEVLNPLGELMGLDGVILLAFILGTPANEIVLPIMLMIYDNANILSDYSGTDALQQVLLQNGWTTQTAVCMILFMLFHWPCATTLITVYKETKKLSTTLLAFALPTITGFMLCIAAHLLFSIS